MTCVVLVVEDETLIRMVAVETLADFGFSAEEAATAGSALQMMQEVPQKFGAVIIDIGLPDRSGDQLAAELRKTMARPADRHRQRPCWQPAASMVAGRSTDPVGRQAL